MQTMNASSQLKPAEVTQLDIFGDSTVILLNPSKTNIATPAAIVASSVFPLTPTTPTSKIAHSADDDEDDAPTVDLEAIDPLDTPETILAKRMFLRMMWDISGEPEIVEPDLFGQTSIKSHKSSQNDQCRLDALIWLYSLNPDGGLVRVEWVCDVLGFDVHRVRRIVGRSVRRDLKRIVHLLSTIVGLKHAQLCEETISDYVNISNWNLN